MSSDREAGATGAGAAGAAAPRWFVVAFWHGHRALLRATGGRFGLWRPKPGGWGTLRLTTTGRRSGQPRQVVVGYIDDGSNLVTMAMNGWGPAEPAWWLNLQAHPDAVAQTRDGVRRVARAGPRARSAPGSGPAGPGSTRTWTSTPPAGRPRPRWSSSSRATPPSRAPDAYAESSVVTPRTASWIIRANHAS